MVIWFVACVGTGLYLPPFMILCGWPLFLLHPVLPVSLPDWFSHYGWYIDCLISLIAWVLLAAIAAVVSHRVLAVRRRRDISKV